MTYTNGDDTAFPLNVPEWPSQPGMTKRERFAMAAMQGLLAGDTEETDGAPKIAALAVENADALIKALNENQT